MKTSYFFSAIFASCLTYSSQSFAEYNLVAPPGPYLGQKTPGLQPEVFAPGIVSTKEHRDYSGFFTPGMQEFYFTRKDQHTKKWSLIVFKNTDTGWSGSIVGPRLGRPILSPDGKTMYLGKHFMNKEGAKWTEPESLGPMFDRDDWGIMRLTASSKGTYVFDDYKNGDVIRISTLKNGVRQIPKLMSRAINTGKYTAHPFVAPDESWLILDSERQDGYGESDLYISFKQEDGSWGEGINMGSTVNSSAREASGYVSPDGKYLFFNRDDDMYWVDARLLDEL